LARATGVQNSDRVSKSKIKPFSKQNQRFLVVLSKLRQGLSAIKARSTKLVEALVQ
jgi:hypothetical protein